MRMYRQQGMCKKNEENKKDVQSPVKDSISDWLARVSTCAYVVRMRYILPVCGVCGICLSRISSLSGS
jgi:hypothetical protein